MADDLWRLTARQMVERLKRGELSPAEAIDAAAARIEETDGAVNAMVTRCFERAHDRAKTLAGRGHPAEPGPGYLYGLPISVKDLDEVAGVRCTYGSPIFADHVPERSNLMVERLEQNGAIVIGKSNTPEFGAGSNTFNEVFGATRNPWDTRMTCGGSSGGAAVNLATGQCWLATGSDLGGSLRIPAAFCSVVGLRPSPGRVAHGTGPTQFNDLPVVGPIARNVGDAALMLDAMVGRNDRDPLSLEAPARPFQEAAAPRPPRRVGWSGTLGLAPVDPEVETICAQAAQRFAGLGAEVEAAHPDLAGAQDIFQAMRAEIFVLGRQHLLEQHRDKLKPEVIWNIEKGMAMNTADAMAAHRARVRLYQNVCDFFERFDLLVTPTVMAPPFPVEIRYLTEVAGVSF
ncbi:MAG TPA: amidase family protein, partial [Alphaproteobacteria bacterium]|nr:amidase family protein [Alphaproteobacteria bacterium]